MRKQFVANNTIQTMEQAYDICPWAFYCEPVEDGWWMFESEGDYWQFIDQL